MTDIQRYEIEMDYEDGYDTYWQSVPCDSGEWVKWDEVQALLAERDALRADAERYRWLRQRDYVDINYGELDGIGPKSESEKQARNFDQITDAARSAEVEGTEHADR